MKLGKKSRMLPSRGGLNDITAKAQGGRATINDYAKVVPGSVREPTPSVINNLRTPRGP
jgi:hypothetical protein